MAVANRRRSGPKARKTIEKKGDGRRKRREKKVRAKKTKKTNMSVRATETPGVDIVAGARTGPETEAFVSRGYEGEKAT